MTKKYSEEQLEVGSCGVSRYFKYYVRDKSEEYTFDSSGYLSSGNVLFLSKKLSDCDYFKAKQCGMIPSNYKRIFRLNTSKYGNAGTLECITEVNGKEDITSTTEKLLTSELHSILTLSKLAAILNENINTQFVIMYDNYISISLLENNPTLAEIKYVLNCTNDTIKNNIIQRTEDELYNVAIKNIEYSDECIYPDMKDKGIEDLVGKVIIVMSQSITV